MGIRVAGYRKWTVCLTGVISIMVATAIAACDGHIDGLHKVEIYLASIGGIVAIVGGYCGFQGWVDKTRIVSEKAG